MSELEALHDEICRTFGAIHCPSLEDLEALLMRHGWYQVVSTKDQATTK